MQSFKDRLGREWTIEIDFSTAIMLKKSHLQFDVQVALDPESDEFRNIASDLFYRGQLIWLLCEQQAEAAGITPEDFPKGFDGDVLDRAFDSLVLEIIDFFPERKRAALRRVLENIRALEGRLVDQANKAIAAFNLDAEVESLIRGSKSGSNLPGSPV